MAKNKGANGTTCTFAGVSYANVGVQCKINGERVDITDMSKAYQIFKMGLPLTEITLSIKGTTVPAYAAEGAVVLTWKDQGSSATLPGAFIVADVDNSGKMNQVLESTVTLIPTETDT